MLKKKQMLKKLLRPPPDFKKWAVICEHIIRHYNEGWANGFKLDMPYWEIWNEPDLDTDDSTNKRTWGGTKAQFFDLYEIAAKHLKGCFPHLKIGGPAISGKLDWAEDFLREMQVRKVPIDFFSWHVYGTSPEKMLTRSAKVRALLDQYGYGDAESILNEWNYVRGWTEDFCYSILAIHGIKGAAFLGACICAAQASSIDMLMYYDTRPSAFCGMFDFYSYGKLKGYYPMYWYGKFYDLEREIPACNEIPDVYSLCGIDKNGKVLSMIVHYTEDDNAPEKQIALDFGKKGTYEIYLLDETHDGTLIATTSDLTLTLPRHSAVLIKEI